MKNTCLSTKDVEELIHCVVGIGVILLFFIFIDIGLSLMTLLSTKNQINEMKQLQENSCKDISKLNTENMMVIKNLANENFFKTSTIIDLLRSIKSCLDKLFWVRHNGSTSRF